MEIAALMNVEVTHVRYVVSIRRDPQFFLVAMRLSGWYLCPYLMLTISDIRHQTRKISDEMKILLSRLTSEEIYIPSDILLV